MEIKAGNYDVKQIHIAKEKGIELLPVLNEQMLRAELERRKLRIQTAVAVLAGFLLMIAAVLLGYSAIDWYPVLSLLCFGYIMIAATGGGVIAIVYSRKGGKTA